MTNDDGLHDSGYTQKQIDRIWRSLAKGEEFQAPDAFACMMIIGLSDGCILPLADETTMRLRTPRAVLDQRIATVRTAIAGGATVQEAAAQLQRQDDEAATARDAVAAGRAP